MTTSGRAPFACVCSLVLAVACGGDDSKASGPGGGGAGGDPGTGGATNGGGSGGAGNAPGHPFEPSSVTSEYVGTGPSSGLSLVAFTLTASGRDGAPTLYVAVKNTGASAICTVDVPVSFRDASDVEIASSPGAGQLDAPMYDSLGAKARCIGPGEVGMGVITAGLGGLDVTQVTAIKYGFSGNIDASATKLGVVTEGSTLVGDAVTGFRVMGTVHNDSPDGLRDPSVHAYAVDSTGRPFASGEDLSSLLLPAGETWSYSTLTIDADVSDYVEYLEYR